MPFVIKVGSVTPQIENVNFIKPRFDFKLNKTTYAVWSDIIWPYFDLKLHLYFKYENWTAKAYEN